MAMVRKSLKQIKASKPTTDRAKFDATTEEDIRRYMIEDGEDPDHVPSIEDIFTPQVIRKRLKMTQEEFARALRIPVATLRNWEQGRNAIDPAARSLLMVVARNPRAALAALAARRLRRRASADTDVFVVRIFVVVDVLDDRLAIAVYGKPGFRRDTTIGEMQELVAVPQRLQHSRHARLGPIEDLE